MVHCAWLVELINGFGGSKMGPSPSRSSKTSWNHWFFWTLFRKGPIGNHLCHHLPTSHLTSFRFKVTEEEDHAWKNEVDVVKCRVRNVFYLCREFGLLELVELVWLGTQPGIKLCLRKRLQGVEGPRGVYAFVITLVCWGWGLTSVQPGLYYWVTGTTCEHSSTVTIGCGNVLGIIKTWGLVQMFRSDQLHLSADSWKDWWKKKQQQWSG